jgi:hypothetical protein
MGRYKDLWESGKYILPSKQEEDKLQQQDALHQSELISSELALPKRARTVLDELRRRRGLAT